MLVIDRSAPTAIHTQIADQFRQAIRSGKLPLGTMLPAEISIARENQISRTTVRKAMDLLVSEGLVVRQPGRGTFVSERSGDTLPMIGVVIPSTRDSFAIDIVLGVEQAAKQDGYLVVFAQTEENPEQEYRDVQAMLQQNVAGFILFPIATTPIEASIQDLIQRHAAMVLVDRYFPELPTDVVTVDNVGGGSIATEHLISLGHKRIGFVASAPLSVTSVRDRLSGYRHALTEHRLVYEESLLLFYDGRPLTLESYLRSPSRPTAVFSTNDYTANDVINAAQRLHMRVPEDLAVVGFDNQAIFSNQDIALTTISQSGRRMGEAAYHLLQEQLKGRQTPRHEILPVNLVIRRSCGAGRNRT